MFIAGIDGGGTHTRIELRDGENRLLRKGEFGPFNLNSIGEEAFRGLLRQVFAWCGGMVDCEKLCVGAAGISNPKVREILEEELTAAGFRGKWKLCGDQEIALRGAMDGPGIAVISGTGSICFGKNVAGETARSGGFGHLIDDGGSGYAIGRDVLSSAVRAYDGRLQNNALLLAVCSRLEGGPEKIVPFVYAPETDKSAIAKFSHIALELAGRGDPEAQGILHREAQELYQLVSAVQQRLGMPKCRIALLGGLIDHDNPYRRVVAEQLTYLGPVIPAAHNALWGAAQMAWEL
jgi:N-acetylglucosamine kinase-like BadF-type ATPase